MCARPLHMAGMKSTRSGRDGYVVLFSLRSWILQLEWVTADRGKRAQCSPGAWDRPHAIALLSWSGRLRRGGPEVMFPPPPHSRELVCLRVTLRLRDDRIVTLPHGVP